jgi:hypothetical protein
MIKKINISKGQTLTRSNITDIISSARSTFQYARFDLYNRLYITVTFNKDQTISVATNSRNLQLYQEMQATIRVYTQARIVEFLYRWLPRITY